MHTEEFFCFFVYMPFDYSSVQKTDVLNATQNSYNDENSYFRRTNLVTC